MANCFPYHGIMPRLGENVFLAPGSVLVGDITLGDGVSIWHNTTLRADVNRIEIGRMTSIQDNSVVHEDSGRGSGLKGGLPTIIGSFVTIGHANILHACTIEDYCLVGMGSILMDGSFIGRGSVIGAGALVTKKMVIPPFSVVLGSPARIVDTLPEESISKRLEQANHYYSLAQEHMNEIVNI